MNCATDGFSVWRSERGTILVNSARQGAVQNHCDSSILQVLAFTAVHPLYHPGTSHELEIGQAILTHDQTYEHEVNNSHTKRLVVPLTA